MRFKLSILAVSALAIVGMLAIPLEARAQSTPAIFKAGTIIIEAPWARATPVSAKVGGGYFVIRNEGKETDRLIGFSSPAAGRGEVHEMSMVDGVMKMREMKAVDIAPGVSVQFKPGGFHVMFLDLRGGLTAGKSVKGQLVFEKAGAIDIEFAVAPIGASSAPSSRTHH